MDKIDISFLSRDTVEAAKTLLGMEITSYIGGVVTSGYITEVEAYLGLNDKAAHTYGGKKTKKNEMMFNPYGHVYVYSMHGQNCMNFLTKESESEPEGILIRGIEPSSGINTMIERRGRDFNIADGPGKLTQSLGINRLEHNGMPLNNDLLTLSQGKSPKEISATKRIGIDTKEEAVDYLYRFIVKGNPNVSRFKGGVDPNMGWK
jgi:DNA-3-methyladenine glycosylase